MSNDSKQNMGNSRLTYDHALKKPAPINNSERHVPKAPPPKTSTNPPAKKEGK